MATRALSIIAPDAHTLVAPIALPCPTNDNFACWTTNPRAVRLLASCAADMPKGNGKERFGWGGGQWFEYIGYRSDALDQIRMQHGERVLDAYHAKGAEAYPAFNAWCHSPNMPGAIVAAAQSAFAVKMEG